MNKVLEKPLNAYILLLQEMENDGLCLSGLDEWNAPKNKKQWLNTPKGKALVKKLKQLVSIQIR